MVTRRFIVGGGDETSESDCNSQIQEIDRLCGNGRSNCNGWMKISYCRRWDLGSQICSGCYGRLSHYFADFSLSQAEHRYRSVNVVVHLLFLANCLSQR